MLPDSRSSLLLSLCAQTVVLLLHSKKKYTDRFIQGLSYPFIIITWLHIQYPIVLLKEPENAASKTSSIVQNNTLLSVRLELQQTPHINKWQFFFHCYQISMGHVGPVNLVYYKLGHLRSQYSKPAILVRIKKTFACLEKP